MFVTCNDLVGELPSNGEYRETGAKGLPEGHSMGPSEDLFPVTFRKPLESEDLSELNLAACFTLVLPVPRTLADV